MATKALFFDIDGTLISFNTHRIPESTKQALTMAKAAGVKIFISTGRPPQFIINLNEIEHLIDGYITTNGANCFVGDTQVYYHPIAKPDVDTLLNHCRLTDRPAFIVGKDSIALFNNKPIVGEVFNSILQVDDVARLCDSINNVSNQDILQISAFFSPEQENEIMPIVPGCVAGRWTPEFADISNVMADKGKGLVAMAQHFGIGIDETMSFGDGGNDIPILAQAGIGVAMGNGSQNVKDAANYVTTSVDDNGVFNALKHFVVI